MENQLADIRDGHTVNLTKQAKDKILECAKNIKSNDQTFKISTLPEVGDELRGLMDEYVQALRSLESSHNAFEEIRDLIETDEVETAAHDLTEFENLFKETLDKHIQGIPSDTSAQRDLEEILKPIRPQDEEIEVEESSEMQIPKDPISQTNIKKATRNKVCNHLYDQKSIDEYFNLKEKSKNRVPCPVAGCTVKAMKRSDLVPDDKINDLIERLTKNKEKSS